MVDSNMGMVDDKKERENRETSGGLEISYTRE